MRLRNIPGAKEAVAESEYTITDPKSKKGAWKDVFSNDHPLHIEIGTGKGRFITQLATENPDINYIGIEKYESVLIKAIGKLKENPLPNLRFIAGDAAFIEEIFEKGEVDRIYLNFSDPWPKDRHHKRRLTSSVFLARYIKVLKDGGSLEFKTDNRGLFDFSVDEINNFESFTMDFVTYDLHNDPVLSEGNIMTEYEEKFSSMGNPICKLKATL